MSNKWKVTALIGILGALIMYLGDMMLYFTTHSIDGNMGDALVDIMANVSEERLAIGGLLGPLAVVPYMIGFYHLYLTVHEQYKKLRMTMLVLFCIGIATGGAYHSHFGILGLVSKDGNESSLQIVQNAMNIYIAAYVIFIFLASFLFIYAIWTRKTMHTRWMALINIPLLFAIGTFANLLPQPLLILINGGWYNLAYIIVFGMSLYSLKRDKKI